MNNIDFDRGWRYNFNVKCFDIYETDFRKQYFKGENIMKKVLAFLLATIMVLSMFVACADDPDKGQEGNNGGANTDNGTAGDAATPLKVPDTNYGGQEFRILGKGDSQAHWKSVDLTAEEMDSDPISLAVYYRNLAVEEKYGITVVEYDVNDYFNQAAEATLSCSSGSDDYDMFALSPVLAVASLINNGYLYDLNEMTYMNLEAEWYDPNSIEQLSLGGKSYLAMGSMLIMDDDATGAVFFNKQMVTENSLPDFYAMVENGTWTIDAMTEYATKVHYDEDGNGAMDVATDTWGCLSEKSVTLAFVAGGGNHIISKDKDDYPTISCNSEHYLDMLEKVLTLSNDFETTMFAEALSGYGDVWVEALDVAFNESRALFYAAWLNRATLFRSMETDFGILPYPKYDADQKDYYSFVSLYCANSISVPMTVTDVDFVSTAIETLSWESMYNSTSLDEAYYTKTLEFKGARDEQSQRMLDIIFENTVFDLGYMFDWGGICSKITGTSGVSGGNASGFLSGIQALTKSINKNIEKTMDKVGY